MDIVLENGKPSCTPTKIFVCSMCDHVFGRRQSLIDHTRTHTGERPFKCTVDDCAKAYKQQSALRGHIRCKHSDECEHPFQCPFPGCQYATKASSAFHQHKKVHSDDRPLACSECHFKTKRKDNLKKHRKRRHSVGPVFKCGHPECEKSFKSSTELKFHFSNRHEERNLKCDHTGCGRNFANAKALNQHKLTFHSTESLVCPTPKCNYRTKTKTNLASHMKIHIRRDEKLPCLIEGCKYKGKHSQALKEHMRHHKTSLPCPQSGCSYFARTKEALKNHSKLHKSSGRPFECPLCSKCFSTLHELQMHCFSHTNEKPFACGQCEYAASFRSDIKKHISSVHANIKFPFIVDLLDDRECLDCKVTLPTADFLLHCEGHVDPVLMDA